MTLVKAKLYSTEAPTIDFMFNPTELSFQGVVETQESKGGRPKQTGKPKVSFSNTKAYKITISKIMFDTYENESDVVKEHISNFRKAVEFVTGKDRPPIYMFQWGDHIYMKRCFVEQLTYKLTMFLPNGTPVRAVIDSLTLKEADEPEENASVSTPNLGNNQRNADSRSNRGK